MGSGKSTVGRSLSAKLALNALDLDDHIVKREALSISEIFQRKGEIYFRKLEGQYLKELLESEEKFILSLGGGTPCYGNNMDRILKTGSSVYLKAGLNTLVERLKKEKESRPLIASLSEEQLTEFVAKHLFERRAFYERANFVVETDGKTADMIAGEIINLLG